jgi:hypothetical protein
LPSSRPARDGVVEVDSEEVIVAVQCQRAPKSAEF